ncbi:MAG: LapA family protein [Xanthomonadales bacterium]|nr:LapA family protein [Xanthomonadales bacterium]
MNRLVFALVALLAVAVGLLVGTLNADPAQLDLLWVQLEWPLGLMLLLFFAAGLVLGLLLLYLSQVLPLRLRLRRAQKQSEAETTKEASPDG